MTITKKALLLTPAIGVSIFVVLYFVATLLYAGGSYADMNAIGFSWKHNYWCNLLNDQAINGMPNPAKPVALAAMIVLCISLTLFWVLVSQYIIERKKLAIVIRVSGSLAMVSAMFLGTGIDHDWVVNFASAWGALAAIGTIIGLYQIKWHGLFALGLFNIVLVGLNNYAYYGNDPIVYLPVVQKISFASFLIWIFIIDLRMFQKQNFACKKSSR